MKFVAIDLFGKVPTVCRFVFVCDVCDFFFKVKSAIAAVVVGCANGAVHGNAVHGYVVELAVRNAAVVIAVAAVYERKNRGDGYFAVGRVAESVARGNGVERPVFRGIRADFVRDVEGQKLAFAVVYEAVMFFENDVVPVRTADFAVFGVVKIDEIFKSQFVSFRDLHAVAEERVENSVGIIVACKFCAAGDLFNIHRLAHSVEFDKLRCFVVGYGNIAVVSEVVFVSGGNVFAAKHFDVRQAEGYVCGGIIGHFSRKVVVYLQFIAIDLFGKIPVVRRFVFVGDV